MHSTLFMKIYTRKIVYILSMLRPYFRLFDQKILGLVNPMIFFYSKRPKGLIKAYIRPFKISACECVIYTRGENIRWWTKMDHHWNLTRFYRNLTFQQIWFDKPSRTSSLNRHNLFYSSKNCLVSDNNSLLCRSKSGSD
jgi:hypothetical protein